MEEGEELLFSLQVQFDRQQRALRMSNCFKTYEIILPSGLNATPWAKQGIFFFFYHYMKYLNTIKSYCIVYFM